MRAVVLQQHGGLDQLKYVTNFPDPVVTDGHVVIRVKASSLNYHDVMTVRGMPGIKVPLPIIIALDMAGEILEAGPGVDGWKAGDRVLVNPLHRQRGLMGEMMHGGLAEKCLVAEHQLIRMPDGVTYEQAAALPVAYGTAHRMLVTHKTVKAGDKVLVLGASGGVGTGCVILARMLGTEVIAAASSADKIRRLSYEGGVDVVINFTGGDTWQPSLRSVKRGGKILVCGATAGYDPKEDLRYIWSFEIQIIGSNSFYDDNLQALMDFIQQGKMKPVIDSTLPLDRAIDGLRMIENREVFGKVVVTP